MAKNSKTGADLLGYYFIIFQSNFKGYVKCWMDGAEDYSFYSEEDFIGLFEKIDSEQSLIFQAMNCLCTTGIYIWDISSGTIKRLTNKSERVSVAEDIPGLNPFKKEKKSWGSLERRII